MSGAAAGIGQLLTAHAQRAKAIPRTNPDWLKPDLLYRGGYDTAGAWIPDSQTWTTSNYVACNAVQGARTFSAEDLK